MVDTSLQNCSLNVTSHYRQENVLFPHFSAKFCRNCTNCNCLARARWSELYDLTWWAAAKRTLIWHTLYDRSYLLEWAQYSADRHCICKFVHLVSRSHSSCTGFAWERHWMYFFTNLFFLHSITSNFQVTLLARVPTATWYLYIQHWWPHC